MADKRKARGAGSSARREREAPTIDLTATEIPSDPPPQAEPMQTPADPPPQLDPSPLADPPPQAMSDPVAEPSVPLEPADPTFAGQAAPDALSVAAIEHPIDPPPEPPIEPPPEPPNEPPPEPEAPPPSHNERRPGLALPLVAGFIGGLVPAALLAGAWYGGVLPDNRRPDLSPRLAQVEQEAAAAQSDVAALQAQTKALAARANAAPNAPAADPSAVDALTQRVAKLETAVKNPPAPSSPAPADSDLAQRVATLESMEKSDEGVLAAIKNQIQQTATTSAQAQHQVEMVSTALNQLGARVDDLTKQQPAGVTPAQFADLQKQVAALEQTAQTAQKQIAQNASANSTARLALAATTLRNAVLTHAPYQAELAQAKALGVDDKQLSALQRFAASGVPNDAALAGELRKLIPQLADTAAPEASGSFLDRLRTNAGRLVRVTPANAPAGDDPADVLARLKLAADRADIAGAVREVGKLPASAQQKAAPWVATVKARDATLSAARTLATDSARALGPG